VATESQRLTQKEFLKVIRWVFGIYLRMAPGKTIMMIVMRALRDLRGLFYAWITAIVIDELVLMTQSGSKDLSILVPYLVMIFLYYIFVEGLVNNFYRYSSRSLRKISQSELEKLLYQQLNRLGIQNLENPETVNRIQRSQQWIYNTYDLLEEMVSFVSEIVRAIASGFIVFSFFPLLIPVLVVLTLIKYIPDRHYIKQDFQWQVGNSEDRRKAREAAYVLENPQSLQEISIVGAYKFMDKKYSDFYSWYNAGMLRIFRSRELTGFCLNALDTAVSVVGYGIIFNNLLWAKTTLGGVTFQVRALDTFSSSMQDILSSLSFMSEFAIKTNDLVILFEMEPAVSDGKIKLPRFIKPPEVEFEHVSFKYPNAEKYVFKDLSFKINSGEKVALVGHNGAGKTTLIKLIARIYQVTEGRVLINGININDLSINDWYKNLGVLFQDFNAYSYLTVEENIFAGKPTKKINRAKIVEAAKRADAHQFISEYTNTYDQLLSEKYEGGIRPSTGQQQKLAIARFFYRDAPLAIFDEPTAAIDAVSEYKIFNKIYRFFTNKTVIIISHRFSTVRNADRIIVLDKGKIIEEGSHGQLQEMDGVYNAAFRLQAEGYRD